jgi:hypothetical protein
MGILNFLYTMMETYSWLINPTSLPSMLQMSIGCSGANGIFHGARLKHEQYLLDTMLISK